MAVVDAIFGTTYAKKLPRVGAGLDAGFVDFHPFPPPPSSGRHIQAAHVGWYLAFKFDSTGMCVFLGKRSVFLSESDHCSSDGDQGIGAKRRWRDDCGGSDRDGQEESAGMGRGAGAALEPLPRIIRVVNRSFVNLRTIRQGWEAGGVSGLSVLAVLDLRMESPCSSMR